MDDCGGLVSTFCSLVFHKLRVLIALPLSLLGFGVEDRWYKCDETFAQFGKAVEDVVVTEECNAL